VPLESIHSAPTIPAPLGMRLLPESSGWIEFHPHFRERLAARGLLTAESLLALPGEIVSGHPDRHVVRVDWPGFSGYLKRQHYFGWRERLKQRIAGFGWSSRSVREARLLRELEKEGFACPQWVAVGEDGNGRAFLLVEELRDSVNLRDLLSDSSLTPHDRSRLAERLGQAVAELHAAGFSTPDLTAKHVFVSPETFAITLIDWQSARRTPEAQRAGKGAALPWDARRAAGALAALDASLSDALADRRVRLRCLWAYARVQRRSRTAIPRFSELARLVSAHSQRARQRRSIRDQRQTPVTGAQRLVWVSGEAVCAIPEIAATWPKPAVAPPFYSNESNESPIRLQLPDGRVAELIRGRSFAPFERLVAAIRGKSWRSPGVKLGRVLFHLQRYGIPAPQLYAFGQKAHEWFVLYEPPSGKRIHDWLADASDKSIRKEVFDQVELLLRLLRESGCQVKAGEPLFWVSEEGRVMVGGIRALQL
jgi:tRNA A-37 threonylcarbamoyl transferase component Bud32